MSHQKSPSNSSSSISSSSSSSYVSIIPKPGRAKTGWNFFYKEVFGQFSKENKNKSVGEVRKLLSEAWSGMSEEQKEPYMSSAADAQRKAMEEWESGDLEREKLRLKWCEKLDVPLTTPWEKVDEANRKRTKQRIDGEGKDRSADEKRKKRGPGRPRKRKSEDSDDESSSSSGDEDDDDEVKAAPGSTREKKQRSANKTAMEKIRSLSDYSNIEGGEGSDEKNSDVEDEETLRIKRLKAKQQSQSQQKLMSNRSTSMFSGSMAMSKSGEKSSAAAAGAGSLKKRSSRLGDAEWESSIWAEERLSAVTKALDRVYDMSLADENFDLFGNDMIQCFYDVATVTGEPIRRKALKYVEHLANRWKYTIMQRGWKEDDRATPYEVIDAIIGMYCMERVGIRHDLKTEILDFLSDEKRCYEAKDYLGWDPFHVNQGPSDKDVEVSSGIQVSRYRSMSNAIIHSFFADRVGLSLGCSFTDIFKWLPTLRPYKSPAELTWQHYIDQCYLVTHIVFTMNNWGELALSPSLFPHEYFFLRANLEIHLQQRDVHLIAEFVDTLRCFGCDDKDPLLQKGMRTLLSLQSENGIWDDTMGEDPYRTYHATMCGAQALLAHRYRGFGPGVPDVLPLLSSWASEDLRQSSDYHRETAEQLRSNQTTDPAITAEIDKQANNMFIALGLIDQQMASAGKSPVSPPGQAQSPTAVYLFTDGTPDDRLTQLRGAIKGCLRAQTHSAAVGQTAESAPVVVGRQPSSEALASLEGEVKTATEVLADRGQTAADMLRALAVALQAYTTVIETSGSSRALAIPENILKGLTELLERSKELAVTTALLSTQPMVAKTIRHIGKESAASSPSSSSPLSSCTLLAELSRVAAEVVTDWKQKLSIPVTFPASIPQSEIGSISSNIDHVESTDKVASDGIEITASGEPDESRIARLESDSLDSPGGIRMELVENEDK